MAYKVKKTVAEGDFFIEHRFQKFPETFEGKWKKVGVFIESNPSAKELTCQLCRQDWDARWKNRPISSKLMSYRVEGVTEPDDFWEWQNGRCGNHKSCWGQKERIWDVRRAKNSQRYSFAHHTLSNNIEKTTDRMYATFVRKTGKENLEYTAITMKASQSADFWPDCLPVVPMPRRHIYISMASKEYVTKEVEKLPKNEWPTTYRTAKYMNPNRMEIRYFDEKPGENTDRFKEKTASLSSLESYLPEIARTIIEMYPGGSGLKVSQYKMIPPWKNEDKRVKVDWLPSLWKDDYGGYIPNIQHGWAGPVVSYWSRLDDTYRYFS
jgi:hypothetical protein